MKIMLINPNFRDLTGRLEKYFTTPFTIPLGLAYLAGYLEAFNYEVGIIDAHAENLKPSQILRRLKWFGPKMIGFTTHLSAGHCASLAKEVKKINSNVITIIGGVVPSLLPRETLIHYPSLDFLVHGEGEITFLKLVEALQSNADYTKIPGLGYRKENGEVTINPRPALIENLDSLPFPARHLFPNRLYRYWPCLPFNIETLITASRGCSAGSCDFCYIGGVFGTKVRKRNPEKVADEMEECSSKYNIQKFSFIDSTFTYDKEFVYKIIDAIKRRNLHKKIRWWCSTRVDCIDEELLAHMKNSGCTAISYGVEFGSQEMLDYFNKKITLKDIEKAFYLTKKMGLWTTGYIMINQYSRNLQAVKDTSKFLLKIKPDLLRITPLIVTPGSSLYYLLQKNGCFKNANYQSYLEGKYCLESRYIKKEELEAIKRKMYLSYYLRPNFLFSLMRSLIRKK